MWQTGQVAMRPLSFLLLAGLASGAVASLVVLYIAARTWRSATDVFHPPRTAAARWPERYPVPPGLQDVEFVTADNLTIRGWHVPGRLPATVIVLHGGMADRTQMAPEALALSRSGLGVLLYDEPGAGGSDGHVTFGPLERGALHAAIAWVRAQDAQQRVGLLGFSQGAFVAAKSLRDEAAVDALAVTGVFVDFPEQTRFSYRIWAPFSTWAALAARRWAGYVPTTPSVLEAVSTFRKPLLIISGEVDDTVPAEHAVRLYNAAQSPKEHWVVPKAGHGDFMDVAPDEYAGRLAGFFTGALGQ